MVVKRGSTVTVKMKMKRMKGNSLRTLHTVNSAARGAHPIGGGGVVTTAGLDLEGGAGGAHPPFRQKFYKRPSEPPLLTWSVARSTPHFKFLDPALA